jgi:hypothetical protein
MMLFSWRHLAFACPLCDRDEIIKVCDLAD